MIRRPRQPYRRVGVREAQHLIRANPFITLLDVRDAASFRRNHLPGALHISIDAVPAFMERASRKLPLLVYCHHGFASQEFARMFSDFGYQEVYSLDGGYEGWVSMAMQCFTPSPLAHALTFWLAENGFPPDNVNARAENGTTPLMRASHRGQTEIIHLLIQTGASLPERNEDGNNALWLACVGNHLDAVELLLDAGIDIDNRNDNGATALMYAASTGKTAIVAELLARGADTGIETLDGFSVLDMAATPECLSLVRRASRERRMARAG